MRLSADAKGRLKSGKPFEEAENIQNIVSTLSQQVETLRIKRKSDCGAD